MNSTKRNVLISVLTISLCLILVAGATFALYQSEAPTNVVVSSAKVDVMATFSNLQLYREIDEKDGDTDKWLAGKIVNDEPGEFQLADMAPYEGFTFTATIQNNSTIPVKWRMQIKIGYHVVADPSLESNEDSVENFAQYFVVKFEGEGLVKGENNTFASDWSRLEKAGTENATAPSFTADVKLSGDAPVDKISRQLTITVTIVAIQANANEHEYDHFAYNGNVTKQIGLPINVNDSKHAVVAG